MTTLLDRAIRLATQGHEGQLRKEAPIPYITHPYRVALMLASYGLPEAVVAAALTHDVLEDTPVTEEELRSAIGDEAFAIVKAVTNDDSLSWEEKKKVYVESVVRGPEGSMAVAIADKVHNLECLLDAYREQGEAIWSHFNAGMEKKIWFEELMLEAAKAHWKHELVDRYEKLLGELKSAVGFSGDPVA